MNPLRTSSIFTARIDRSSSLTQEPVSEDAPEPDGDVEAPCDEAPPVQRWCEVALEAEILATLQAGSAGCERIATAFERKERELAAIFERLSVADARSLHRRLTMPAATDPIALKFGQLVIERQQRLIAFLAGARRREALRQRDVRR